MKISLLLPGRRSESTEVAPTWPRSGVASIAEPPSHLESKVSDSEHRLPGDVVPSHYQIELTPDLDRATFEGSVLIDIDVSETIDEIACNAAELEIRDARLWRDGSAIELHPALDEATERLLLRGDTSLPTGSARLEISFNGVLNDRLKGFYRSTFTDDDGTKHTIATTQFQSTDARRAFPCWDEPAFKATFTVSLVVPEDLLAISNTSETTREQLGDGRVKVTFAKTMPMSTYLVAFVVGPLEATPPIDVDGVPVRVVHRPGRGQQTAFALETAAHALRWMTAYYDIPYPSDKVDLVAIPDFAFGAMENLGCVTFREVLVLIDPETASQPELQRVAEVVNHELAHMWFGDLVTMRWWEGIWLNEAFATFMETSCTDAFRPDWEVWTTFGRVRAEAHAVDALASTRAIEFPVVTPAEAEGMFDVITYEKGASVLRMLERYLGPETFRDGVRRYLTRHIHGNTETTDLWDSLEEASGEPVRSMMDDWVYQGGYPLISARQDEHGLTLEQHHFTLDPSAADDRTWAVPVRIRSRDGDTASEQVVLLDRAKRVYTASPGELVTANVDGSGFYRVAPDPMTLERISHRGAVGLTNRERHSFVDDLWALTLSGRFVASEYFDIVTRGFRDETDLTVWQALSAGLGALGRLVDGQAMERFSEEVAALCGPISSRLGDEGRPDESDRTRELRATVLRLRGVVAELPEAIEQARAQLGSDDATLAAAALTVVAHHGSSKDFDEFRSRFLEANDPQTEQRHLRALADFPDPELVMAIVEETRGGQVRSQDGAYLIGRALTNRHAGARVWTFVTGHWDELNEIFPSNSIVRMLGGITALDQPELAASVTDFLSEQEVPQGAKQLAQHLERLRVNVMLREREAERFRSALTDR
jgi:puromycin-sensitive aminopeptidase